MIDEIAILTADVDLILATLYMCISMIQFFTDSGIPAKLVASIEGGKQ